MKFAVLHNDPYSNARTGKIDTDHGTIMTPIFMPVGTAGSVKAVHVSELEKDVKAQIILGNTYHLYLRPGMEIVQHAGGIQRFNGWNKPMLTDSGGYQIYSLAENRKISPEGVTFQSHIDGSRHQFTPESAIDIQRALGADIMMAFDECTPYPCPEDYAKNSLKITHEWLSRCIKRFDETECPHGYQQNLFPIVQGSVYPSLRAESAEYIAKQNAVGNAIGGLSVGEPEELMYSMTDLVCKILPRDKPRYLMGVGTPVNLLESISLGIDMFDCVIPTRNGRNGWLYTRNGILNMKNEKWKDDFSAIDPEGDCFVDHFYTKAYLRHLFVAGEILASMIASLHNLRFYLKLMEDSREMINQGQFTEWKNQLVPKLKQRL